MVDLREIRVTVLGKFERIAGLNSGVYLAEAARTWQAPLRILTTFDHAEALSYLRRPGVLAVIPSLAENSPCVVAECLECGLPFLASRGGGTAELVAETDRARCLFEPTAAALAFALREALRIGHAPAQPAVPQSESVRQWVALLSACAEPTPMAGLVEATTEPLVSVCFVGPTTRADPSLRSLVQQTYSQMEIVIVEPEETPAQEWLDLLPKCVRRLRIPQHGLAAARNAAAQEARGKFLVFLSETSATPTSDCVARLVLAAVKSGSDIVTCLPIRHKDAPLLPLPIGGCAAMGALENCFGGNVFLISTAAFRRGQGFPIGCEESFLDWAFLAASVLDGARIEVLPLQLYGVNEVQTRTFDAGNVVRAYRTVLSNYAKQPALLFEKAIEILWQLPSQSTTSPPGLLSRLGPSVGKKALALSALDPSSPEAASAFVDYCFERCMVDLATDFAMLNSVLPRADVIDRAQRMTEATARSWIGQRRLELSCALDLTDPVRGMLRPIAPLVHRDLQRPADSLVRYPLGLHTQIVRAAAACPPGIRSLRARATIDPRAGASAAVAIAIAAPDRHLILSEDALSTIEASAWSGWVTADASGGGELRINLEAPNTDLLDLYLLSRPDDHCGVAEALVTWNTVQATLAINGTASPSAVERRMQLIQIPAEILNEGTLLTDVSDFPHRVIVPGKSLLTHPVPRRAILVRLARSLPAGATGLRCVVSVDHEKARPVEFGFWIDDPTSDPPTEADLIARAAFSGWMTVRNPFVRHHLTARLASPALNAMDIYLSVRVREAADVHFCWAFWHQLLVMQLAPPQQACDASTVDSGSAFSLKAMA
jgi:hypothetical protein